MYVNMPNLLYFVIEKHCQFTLTQINDGLPRKILYYMFLNPFFQNTIFKIYVAFLNSWIFEKHLRLKKSS